MQTKFMSNHPSPGKVMFVFIVTIHELSQHTTPCTPLLDRGGDLGEVSNTHHVPDHPFTRSDS